MACYKIKTYGCQMNIHESEKIAGYLKELGYEESCDEENFDIIVFNTCCIRDNAEKKILGHIGEVKALRAKNPRLIVAIVGCMTQQENSADKLVKRFNFIDIILGTNNLHLLKECIQKVKTKRHLTININNAEKPDIVEFNGAYRTSGINAWVNIMYGCNNFCTYCIVPYVRGRERSREMATVVQEVKTLLAKGYKEITLLGQNVNSYGNDLNSDTTFAKLLDTLGSIEGKHRIGFMTSHPKDLNIEVIDIIVKHSNLCNYIHLPIQAGSDKVLKDMNRHYDTRYYLDLLTKIRHKLPNCGISTDLMVGFPTETDEDFNQTIDLIKKANFSTAFTYIYSPRNGTIAAKMEQIPYKIKSERIQKLIKIQNEITIAQSAVYHNKTYEVLCQNTKGEGYVCGRTECGRLVTFKGDRSMIGNFYNVIITKSQSASLCGEIVNN